MAFRSLRVNWYTAYGHGSWLDEDSMGSDVYVYDRVVTIVGQGNASVVLGGFVTLDDWGLICHMKAVSDKTSI